MKISLCHGNWGRGEGLDKNSAHGDLGKIKIRSAAKLA